MQKLKAPLSLPPQKLLLQIILRVTIQPALATIVQMKAAIAVAAHHHHHLMITALAHQVARAVGLTPVVQTRAVEALVLSLSNLRMFQLIFLLSKNRRGPRGARTHSL